MRKRSIAAAGIMVMCLGLMACGSASNTGSSNTATQAASTSSAGYVYTSNGTDIKINDDVNAIVSKLGTPKGGTYEAKSCALTVWISSGTMMASHFRPTRRMARMWFIQ